MINKMYTFFSYKGNFTKNDKNSITFQQSIPYTSYIYIKVL